MKWFGKLFKKKRILYNQSDYKLLIINDQAELLHEIFGISEERADALLDVCIHAYHKNNQLHSCLVDVVEKCVHTNEIVFATMMMNKVIEKHNTKQRIGGLLSNLFNHD